VQARPRRPSRKPRPRARDPAACQCHPEPCALVSGWGARSRSESSRRDLPAILRSSDALDLDLGLSPVFITMPVLRHDLHNGGRAEEFLMIWISVPDLSIHASPQRARLQASAGSAIRTCRSAETASVRPSRKSSPRARLSHLTPPSAGAAGSTGGRRRRALCSVVPSCTLWPRPWRPELAPGSRPQACSVAG